MNNIPRFHMERYVWANQRRRFRQRAVTALASVVVFCTTYALILPAITLEHRCGMEEHVHSDACYTQVLPDAQQEPICGLVENEEHTHTDICYASSVAAPDTLTCTITDETHVHSLRCYGTWELTCPLPEHVHTDDCFSEAEPLSEDAQEQADTVVALINALPDTEALCAELADADEDTYIERISALLPQVKSARSAYNALPTAAQTSVGNLEKLITLESLLTVEPLATTNTVNVTAVNKFSWSAGAIIIRSSVDSTISGCGIGHSYFQYWCAIQVQHENGQYIVKKILSDESNKGSFPVPSNGFVLVYHSGNLGAIVNVNVGDIATLSNDFWKSGTKDYTGTVYGTVTFSSPSTIQSKPAKDNSNKLTTVEGADTRDLIEVNLYDYGSNINTLWNSNKNYPGFQQDGGQKSVSSTYSSNFGNNITKDLSAGNSAVTNQGGTINATNSAIAGAANAPISDAMLGTLKDGYPALADGTSLSYLFSNSDYAEKQNTQSINGLFRYHEDTGAYTFNSRENHAQFNSVDDTFTLYEQIISANAFWYPFGNFLPFNDIVHESAQASTIDRAYLQSIATSAQYKYNNDAGSEYQTLATSLNDWIAKMDAAYPSGWGAAQAINEYFNGAGPGKTDKRFDFSKNSELLNKVYSIDFDEPTDFYFGMEMKMNLMQPKGGLTGKDGKQPMVFYFTGDDDVWVYIDDVLFLDLSGIHRHVGGEIDFTNGVVKYYALDVSTGDVSETPYKTVKFSELVAQDQLNDKGTFKDYSHHTFNFYYMERGAGSGVCRMNFNFPLLKKNSISVTKELRVDDESKLPLLGNPDFKFQVLRADANGKETDTLFIGDGVSYEIRDTAGNTIDSGTTDANGVFTLKANQTAVFSDIKENSGKYFVRELLDTTVFEQYGTIEVNGSSQTTNYDVTVGSESFKGVNSPVKDMSDGSTVFRFNNHVDITKLGSLSITKTLTAYPKARALSQFEFEVWLDGTLLPVGTTYTVGDAQKTVEKEAGIIVLAPGETAVITGILAGSTFTVQETAASAKGYIPSYSVDSTAQTGDSASGIITAKTTVAVVINNAEKGAEVQIPVQKLLEFPDGTQHTYAFTLTQVTDKDGQTPTDPAFSKTLTVDITNDPVNAAFEISYAQTELNGLPQTFYYRITEDTSADEAWTIFDTSVYVAEVTISETNGELSAAVTQVWKNGQETDTGQIAFTNTIARYELPETGGTGTRWYTMGGLSLLTLVGLTYKRRRRKGAAGHS